jgi:hypothetical protein
LAIRESHHGATFSALATLATLATFSTLSAFATFSAFGRRHLTDTFALFSGPGSEVNLTVDPGRGLRRSVGRPVVVRDPGRILV